MKKVKSKLIFKVVEIRRSLCLSDKQIIKKKLGYSSSSIYDSVLKYRHQNYVNRKPNQS